MIWAIAQGCPNCNTLVVSERISGSPISQEKKTFSPCCICGLKGHSPVCFPWTSNLCGLEADKHTV